MEGSNFQLSNDVPPEIHGSSLFSPPQIPGDLAKYKLRHTPNITRNSQFVKSNYSTRSANPSKSLLNNHPTTFVSIVIVIIIIVVIEIEIEIVALSFSSR